MITTVTTEPTTTTAIATMSATVMAMRTGREVTVRAKRPPPVKKRYQAQCASATMKTAITQGGRSLPRWACTSLRADSCTCSSSASPASVVIGTLMSAESARMGVTTPSRLRAAGQAAASTRQIAVNGTMITTKCVRSTCRGSPLKSQSMRVRSGVDVGKRLNTGGSRLCCAADARPQW